MTHGNKNPQETLTILSTELGEFAQVIRLHSTTPLDSDLRQACSLFCEYLRAQLNDITIYLCYSNSRSQDRFNEESHHTTMQLQQLSELLVLNPSSRQQAQAWQQRLLKFNDQMQQYSSYAA